MNRLVTAGLIVILAAMAVGCASTDPSTPTAPAYQNITSAELKSMIDNKGTDDFFLVDVHIPEQGHLEKTDAFIPFNQVSRRLDEFPADKSTKIVLYCRGGGMSRDAANELSSLGYTDLYNLAGGVEGWKAAGYAVGFPVGD